LSLDSNQLVKAVKTAAVDAVRAMKPFAFTYGTVTAISPLTVQVDQKLTLTADQLLLTNAVRDFTVNATVNHTTGNALGSADISHTHPYSGSTSDGASYSGTAQKDGEYDLTHSHSYSGDKAYTFHFALKTGEKVILLQCDGGQRFIILDRVEAMS
jgi:hypothetical protein